MSRRNSLPSEAEIQAEIMLRFGAIPDLRLFRNNTGLGWSGQLVSNVGGIVTLRNARPVRFGLCVGSSDLIGWRRGHFLAIEVKDHAGQPTAEQKNFIAHVNQAGGLGGVVRSVEDTVELLGL